LMRIFSQGRRGRKSHHRMGFYIVRNELSEAARH
jgi:hypothetical protein